MDKRKIPCSVCGKLFEFGDIIVTVQGLYCSEDLPEGVVAHFFTVHLSWTGMFALLDFLGNDASVDQLFIVDKIKDKLQEQVVRAIKDYVEGAVQISDPESLGKGDEEH